MKAFILTAATALTLPSFALESGLKPDPKTLFGTLDNGMNYIIRPNAEPPGRFSVRLHIDAGSLSEAENQRGVAHFLEHMVFNGTKNFTAAEIVPKMQRLGIAFGAHANAYTAFDETVYMLDLPNLKEETQNLTFTVMRDFADGALLKKEEIDKERDVIISEKTSRDSVGYRIMLKQLGYLLPDSRITKRVPIGVEEVIKNAPRERFTDFYRDYYHPSRMTFVVVGDFKADEMEKRVRDTFISLTNPEKPGADPAIDSVPSGYGFRTAVFSDPEIVSDSLSLYSTRPFEKKPDTKANRLEQYPLSAAHAILSRRFAILAKKEGSPILGGGSYTQDLFQTLKLGSISITPGTEKWKEALPVMEQEFRRALDHGFTQVELDEVAAQWINAAEEAVKRAATRDSKGIAMEYVGAVNQDDVVTTPEADLEITKEAVSALNLESIHAAFRKFWDTEDLSLVLTSNKEEKGTSDTLKKLYLESREVAVTPPAKEELKAFAYTNFGPSGKIRESKEVEDLGITQLVLENEIRVNLKKTDFKKNSISMVAKFGSGTFTMPKDQPALDQFASAVFQGGGLGQHSEDDLQRILAGKNVGVGLGIGSASFDLIGRSTPEDLELQLQLMCAYLTDPGYRPEAARQFKMQLPMIYNQMKHTSMGAMMQMGSDLAGGDYRAIFPEQKIIASYETTAAKEWLSPAFKDAPMELSIVGDLDLEKTKSFLLKTFGALPKRKTEKPNYDDLRTINIPERPAQKKLTYESKIPNATAMVSWAIPSAYKNNKQARRFPLLAAILSDRMREEIREKLGGSYSPRANAAPDDQLLLGYLQANATVKPDETKKYGELMIKLADDMARGGISADELDRARKPIQSNLKKALRENGYWLNSVMATCQADPKVLELARNRDEDFASISVEELNALAAKYLKKENSLLYEIVPTTE